MTELGLKSKRTKPFAVQTTMKKRFYSNASFIFAKMIPCCKFMDDLFAISYVDLSLSPKV